MFLKRQSSPTCCFFYLKPFPCFTVPSFNIFSKSPGLLKTFLHNVKNAHTTSEPEVDLLWAQTPSNNRKNVFAEVHSAEVDFCVLKSEPVEHRDRTLVLLLCCVP